VCPGHRSCDGEFSLKAVEKLAAEKQRLQAACKVAEKQLVDLMDQHATWLREWSAKLKTTQKEMASLLERIDKLVKRETQLLERGLAALEVNRTND